MSRRMSGMLHSAGTPLPEYRVKASIDTADSGNRIQDDEFARRCGFRSGLVPGASVYAYMSRPLVEFFGKEWLKRGSADVRFVRPVYEGEELRIGGFISSVERDGTIVMDCQAANHQGVVCGIGTAKLAPQLSVMEPALDDYEAGRAKSPRFISLESIKIGECLTPTTAEFTWNIHWQYCQKSIRDHHPLYGKAFHPGWIMKRATQILASNYAIEAWIDVSSQVQNFHFQEEEECPIETRGRVRGKFERDGDHFIELDLAVFAQTRCLQTIRYTAIFRIARNAA
jgi:hypothetical protein